MMAQLPEVRLLASQTGAVDAALLAGTHADGLAAEGIAHAVGLGVLQGDEGNDQVALLIFGEGLVFGDHVLQPALVDLHVVAALLKGHTEHLLVLHRSGHIVGVDLHDVVVALLLALQHFQGLGLIAGGDDAVGHLMLDELGGGQVAHIRQGDPIAEAGHPVCTAGTGVGAGQGAQLQPGGHAVHLAQNVVQRQPHRRTGGGDVFEGSGAGQTGGLLQLLYQLPAVQGIQKVDVAGAAVQHGYGQLTLLHEDLGRLLVGIAAVFQFQFLHVIPPHCICCRECRLRGRSPGRCSARTGLPCCPHSGWPTASGRRP